MSARRRPALVVIFLILVLVALGAPRIAFAPDPTLYSITGEEDPGAQARGLLQWLFHWTRPQPRTAPDAPIAHTHLPPFGVNTFLEQEVELEKRERSLEMIADAGFHWIRQEFPWEDIEIHGKGDFEDRRHEPYRSAWEKYDHIVGLAEEYDLRVIARLSNPPSWSRAQGDESGTYAPPDDFEDYGDYVAAVASRYKGRVRHYQVWNEPNIYPEWGDQPVDPEAYTRLLCLAHERIKAVDPDAVVISGALAPTDQLGTASPAGGNNLMDTLFLQRMYDAGAAECFDVMAVNDYMLWSGPTDRRLRPHLINFSRPLWVRDVMVANGDAHKPIWFTEMNSNVAPEGIPPIFGRTTEGRQARYAVDALERVQREWPWAGVVNVWFFKRASDAERDQAMYYFRLVEPDFTPMPVYDALKAYLTNLQPTLYPGHHFASAWQVGYAGEWQTTGEGARRGEGGDSFSVTWEGRSLTLLPGEAPATVHVVEDGGEAQEVRLAGEPITLSRHLLRGRHTLELTVVEGPLEVRALLVR